MLERLVAYFTDRTWVQLGRDFLDVSIVYYLFYRALLVVRGTRAIQVGFGLGAVLLLYVVAQRLQLETVINILGALISSMILLVVVVFQNDIRRGLMRLGRGATWTGTRNAETRVIDDVVEAATELARHRMGAIICFEKDANLDEFVEQSHKGIDLDAQVSRELLVSLFVPEGTNKLHDGAIIIRNLRIAKAGVFFPMGGTKAVDTKFGSRHRAAIAITEETDAVLVVVSEERGTISFCFNGNIVSPISAGDLRSMLEAEVGPKKKPAKKNAAAARPSASPPASKTPPAADRSSRISAPPPRPSQVPEERPSRSEDRKTATSVEDTGPVSIRFSGAPDSERRATQPAEDTPKPLRRSVPKDKEKDAAETDAAERPSLEAVANPTPLAPASTPKPMRGDGNDGSPSDPGEGA
ncbi:MAG: diadenylate cyclase CdaA [Polyangiaceae bacterium]